MKSAATALQSCMQSLSASIAKMHPLAKGLLFATFFGLLTGYSAQFAFRLPFTPVPITGQVLVVLLAGGLLGPRWGAISQIEYLLLGAFGLPIFAGGIGGLAFLLTPSAGYIFGFIAAAWVVGTISRDSRGWLRIMGANLAGLCTIYLFGWFWLAFWLGKTQEVLFAPAAAFALGVVPFVLVDLFKAIIASQAVFAARAKKPQI